MALRFDWKFSWLDCWRIQHLPRTKDGLLFWSFAFRVSSKEISSITLTKISFHRAIFGFAVLKPMSNILSDKWGGGYFGPKENCESRVDKCGDWRANLSRHSRHRSKRRDSFRRPHYAFRRGGSGYVPSRIDDYATARHGKTFLADYNLSFLRFILCCTSQKVLHS